MYQIRSLVRKTGPDLPATDVCAIELLCTPYSPTAPRPLDVRIVYAIQRPSGEPFGRIHRNAFIVVTPAEGSHRCIEPAASLKKRRLGIEAQTAIVMPVVE